MTAFTPAELIALYQPQPSVPHHWPVVPKVGEEYFWLLALQYKSMFTPGGRKPQDYLLPVDLADTADKAVVVAYRFNNAQYVTIWAQLPFPISRSDYDRTH